MTKLNFEELYKNKQDPWGTSVLVPERYRLQHTFKLISGGSYRNCLDVGCGEGTFTQCLTTICNQVIAIDISPTAIKRAKNRHIHGVKFKCGDITDLKFKDKFDLILCLEMLYYLDKKTRKNMVDTFFDMLETNGTLLVSARVTGENYFTYNELIEMIGSKFKIKMIAPVRTKIYHGNNTYLYSIVMLLTKIFPKILAETIAVLSVKVR